MNHKEISPFECAAAIEQALPKGILLTTKANGKVNSMVIGWGMLGTVWSTPTFVTFVRTSRYTHELLAANPQFTINVPVGGPLPKDVFRICGTQSGREMDKVKAAGLTLVDGEKVDVPAIAQAPLTLECEVMYRARVDQGAMPPDLQHRYYVQDTDGNHDIYYGRIVASYLLEP